MRGGLRWLYRPFQVLCVLVAVLLTAAFSLSATFAGHAGGNAPIPDKPNLGSLHRAGATEADRNHLFQQFFDWQARERP
jgi:hypothetical protein